MIPASNRGARKAVRDLVQVLIAVVAAGGATALIDLIVDEVPPAWGVLLAFLFKVLVAYAQNALEAKGRIPVLLPTAGLVTTGTGGAVGRAVGSVAPTVQSTVTKQVAGVTETVTNVAGPVLDSAGQVVGSIDGAVGGLLGAVEDLGGV